MHLTQTPLAGAYLIEPRTIGDERGYFARLRCAATFAEHGLESVFVQSNTSYNRLRGTVRGMHFQRDPHAEVKLVRCTSGAIFDVVVDLRPDSPTRGRWAGYELSASNLLALYVPRGFAHGYQTLTDDAQVYYDVSTAYAPDHEAGCRHDDPLLAIDWPLSVGTVSDKDRRWPLLSADGA